MQRAIPAWEEIFPGASTNLASESDLLQTVSSGRDGILVAEWVVRRSYDKTEGPHLMKNLLIDSLIDDHRSIQARIAELKRELARPRPDEALCMEMFRVLKATVMAHAKAEEFALYGVVEEPHNDLEAGLQHFAFEGYEEHDLTDFLMKEMATSEELSHQWRAQVTVLSEMLEKHMLEEERDFFPKVRELLSEKTFDELGRAYVQERDVIFAKKMGVRPALSLAPSIHH